MCFFYSCFFFFCFFFSEKKVRGFYEVVVNLEWTQQTKASGFYAEMGFFAALWMMGLLRKLNSTLSWWFL